jgi:uncharacterized protein (DUF4415 family)
MTRKAKTTVESDAFDDNPEWTAENFARAVTGPEFFAAWGIEMPVPRRRGPQREPTKQAVSIRLSRSVLEEMRALGPGWQAQIDEILQAWLIKQRRKLEKR